jgi:hypothetical protein
MDASDKRQNDRALKNGDDRLFSSYTIDKDNDEKVYIITEWDRSVTTILTPDDY